MSTILTEYPLLWLALLVFVAVLLLLEGGFLFWRAHRGAEARRMRDRLDAIAARRERLRREADALLKRDRSNPSAVQRWAARLPHAPVLHRVLVQAGLDWHPGTVVLASLVLGAAAFMVCAVPLRLPAWFAFGAAAAAFCLPGLYIRARRSKRLQLLERQLPDAIDLINRALRSGQAFPVGLQLVGEELPDPIAAEFRTVHDEINFGVSVQQALGHLSERVPSTDVRYFVVSVLIQRESGGNLTEVLANLSRLIRERLKFRARVRVLSSEGRFSAWVLGVLPFALVGAFYLLNPKFISVLWTDPIGIGIVQAMLTLMAIGVLILRRIARVRV